MSSPAPSRVIAYIDGFNLYYGLRDSGFRRYYWLDLLALVRNLLRPGQWLAGTKYFTARIAGPKPADPPAKAAALREKRRRQSDYLEALGTLPDLIIYHGHYLAKDVHCRRCGANWTSHEEKMTDVCIATELLVDAFADAFDTALLISADSDLVPPVQAVRRLFPNKRIVVFLPPGRKSHQLQTAGHACFTIGRATLRKSQLPDRVTKPDGHIVTRPATWR